jgi:hypothetical protein
MFCGPLLAAGWWWISLAHRKPHPPYLLWNRSHITEYYVCTEYGVQYEVIKKKPVIQTLLCVALAWQQMAHGRMAAWATTF